MPLFIIILLLLLIPVSAQAASYEDISRQIKIEVSNRTTQGQEAGSFPLQVSWSLDAAWGTGPECDAYSWEGTVKFIQRDLGDDSRREVASWPINSKTGSASYTAPANTPYQAYTYFAKVEYTAKRSCGGGEETAERQTEVEALIPYIGEDPCDWKISWSEGSAGVRRGSESSPLIKGDGVMVGDTLVTGRGGKLELKNSKSNAIIRVSPGSRLKLKSAYCEDQPWKFSFKLTFGRIWSKVANALSPTPGPVEVETGNSEGSTRGTIWTTEAKKVNGRYVTKVETLKGIVVLNSKSNPTRKVWIKRGFKTEVVGNGPVRRPHR